MAVLAKIPDRQGVMEVGRTGVPAQRFGVFCGASHALEQHEYVAQCRLIWRREKLQSGCSLHRSMNGDHLNGGL